MAPKNPFKKFYGRGGGKSEHLRSTSKPKPKLFQQIKSFLHPKADDNWKHLKTLGRLIDEINKGSWKKADAPDIAFVRQRLLSEIANLKKHLMDLGGSLKIPGPKRDFKQGKLDDGFERAKWGLLQKFRACRLFLKDTRVRIEDPAFKPKPVVVLQKSETRKLKLKVIVDSNSSENREAEIDDLFDHVKYLTPNGDFRAAEQVREFEEDDPPMFSGTFRKPNHRKAILGPSILKNVENQSILVMDALEYQAASKTEESEESFEGCIMIASVESQKFLSDSNPVEEKEYDDRKRVPVPGLDPTCKTIKDNLLGRRVLRNKFAGEPDLD